MTLLSELTGALGASLARSWREHSDDDDMDRSDMMATATVLDIASILCAAEPDMPQSSAGTSFDALLIEAAYDLAIVEQAAG